MVYGPQFSLAGTNRLAPAFLAAVGASWGVVGALAPLWYSSLDYGTPLNPDGPVSENRTTTCDHTYHTDLIDDPTDYIDTDVQMTVTSTRTPTRHHAYTKTAHAPMLEPISSFWKCAILLVFVAQSTSHRCKSCMEFLFWVSMELYIPKITKMTSFFF